MKRLLNRDLLMRALLVALLTGAVAWLVSCTEWVEVDEPVPPRGEAARNPLYATQRLVRAVGATVATPDSLAQLPPPGATLLLTSWYWDIFPERAQRLKAWVDDGGHLVLYAGDIHHQQLKGWLPIRQVTPPRKASPPVDEDEDEDGEDEDSEEADDGAANEDAKPQLPPGFGRPKALPCDTATEPDNVPSAYADGDRRFKLCTYVPTGRKLQAETPASWSLDGPTGPLVLRAARGRGDVTVIHAPGLLDNDRVLKGDNGLAVVAALQARPGAHVWFVAEEARAPLLTWLWREAWVAVLLGAAALALALWRGARRFGPLRAPSPPGRRSMAEQISGTAQFLRSHGPEALLAAQIRALDKAAGEHVRNYHALDRSQRAQAIAHITGQDAAALGRALDKHLARRRTDLPARLELLETARRVLAQRGRTIRQ